MPHEAIQDRDWSTLKKGDPLWRDRDGNSVPYDGAFGDEIVPIFVNEGGYYYASSGRGIGVAQRSGASPPPAPHLHAGSGATPERACPGP